MPNYNYVVDSSFKPFTFQEMVTPWLMYGQAAKEIEESYDELADKTNTFKYLEKVAEENPNSQAAKVYKGYADELKKQIEDFGKNGLTIANRGPWRNLKRRYKGEIGRLEEADKLLQEERKRRRDDNDTSMMYAVENLSLDDFMDNKTPNLYRMSGNELYTKAANAGQRYSSRIFTAGDNGDTLGGYFRDYLQTNGITNEDLAKFQDEIMNDFSAKVSTLPEFQQIANSILEANGVNENFKDNLPNLRKAQQQVIRGLIDGAVYTENHNPVRNPGKMSAEEAGRLALGWAGHNLSERQQKMNEAAHGMEYDPTTGTFKDKNEWMYSHDDQGNRTGYNPEYFKDVTVNSKTGKPSPKVAAIQTKEEKAAETEQNSLETALLKLGKEDLASNKGFEVTVGNHRRKFKYIGALSSHGGKWYSGILGEDNPGHKGWGFTSSSNVENKWGTFSAEGSDDANMRVLDQKETLNVLQNNPELLSAVTDLANREARNKLLGYPYKEDSPMTTLAKEADFLYGGGSNKYSFDDKVNEEASNLDMYLIEVPNEQDSNKKGYLIAVGE